MQNDSMRSADNQKCVFNWKGYPLGKSENVWMENVSRVNHLDSEAVSCLVTGKQERH